MPIGETWRRAAAVSSRIVSAYRVQSHREGSVSPDQNCSEPPTILSAMSAYNSLNASGEE